MKLTTFMLIISLMQVSAVGFGQKISLNEQNVSLEKVLESIRRQSGFEFVYVVKDIQNQKVSVILNNATIEDAIKETIKDLPISFKFVKKNIVLTKKASAALKETKNSLIDKVVGLLYDPIKIYGKVTDSLGIPMEGASVIVFKKVKTSPSDASRIVTRVKPTGEFDVLADVGDRIVILYVGYESHSIIVQSTMTYQNIILKKAELELKEVTIQTGYQQLSKERATGSFSKPDMKTLANRTGTMDVISRLDGQIAGLVVSPNTFQISANGEGQISQRGQSLIRGITSVFLPTEPLYVVNGIIVPDFRALNLDDIDDITVLKDAAAAAIWGAQAANGVIVITTKSGRKNQKLQISYAGSLDFKGKPDLEYQRYLNSKDYVDVAKQIFDPVTFPYSSLSYSAVTPLDEILYNQYDKFGKTNTFDEQAQASLDKLSATNNREQIKDLFYRNAVTSNHTLSASGGNNMYNFYSSLGYTDAINNRPGSVSNSYRFNLSQNLNIGSRIVLSVNAALLHSLEKETGSFLVTNEFLPYQLFKDDNGSNINMPFVQGLSPEIRNLYQSLSGVDMNTYNAFDERDFAFSNSKNLTANLTANATVKLFKGLSFNGNYGYLTSPGTSVYYIDHNAYSMRTQLISLTIPAIGDSGPVYLIPQYGGTYNTRNMNQRNWTIRNQMIYDYSGRGGNDRITIQAGQEARESLTNSNSTNILGYDLDLQTYPILDYKTLNDGISNTVTGYGALYDPQFQISEQISRFNSYYALGSYTLNQKYSIDGSWRVDHSNLFGSDVSAQNKPVWSAGGRWNLSKEDFMKPVNWLNNLSLRATYGITGNSPYVGAATTYDILGQEQYTPYPLTGGAAYRISNPANNKLSWETTHTTNLGLDFSIFKSRLSGSIEYYRKITTNLLGNWRLNPVIGYTSGLVNIGKLKNEGLNVSLYSTNIEAKDFTWSSSLIFSYNKNKLIEYTPPSGDNAALKIAMSRAVGYAMSSTFSYRYAGLDNRGYPQVKLSDGTITTDPMAVKEKDLVYMGTKTPLFNGGLSNTFRYKQFELSLNMVYSLGAVMKRDLNSFWSDQLYRGNFSGNISPDFLNRWQKPGDENITNIPGYLANEDYTSRNIAYYTDGDINIVSASYIKLRDIMLSYTLSPKVLNALKIQSLTLRAQMNNIMLWKANKYGIDPEYQDYTSGFRGIRNEHTFNLGLNINF